MSSCNKCFHGGLEKLIQKISLDTLSLSCTDVTFSLFRAHCDFSQTQHAETNLPVCMYTENHLKIQSHRLFNPIALRMAKTP